MSSCVSLSACTAAISAAGEAVGQSEAKRTCSTPCRSMTPRTRIGSSVASEGARKCRAVPALLRVFFDGLVEELVAPEVTPDQREVRHCVDDAAKHRGSCLRAVAAATSAHVRDDGELPGQRLQHGEQCRSSKR